MATITAALVKDLREKTGAGMMDCKNALSETAGDIEAAIDWLRKKGLAKAAKKSGRVAADGLVGVAVEANFGVVVEVNSETDFVARNDDFQALVRGVLAVALDKGAERRRRGGQGRALSRRRHGRRRDRQRHRHHRREHDAAPRRRGCMSRTASIGHYVHGQIVDGLGRIGVIVALESTGDARRARRARPSGRDARRRRQPDRARRRQASIRRRSRAKNRCSPTRTPASRRTCWRRSSNPASRPIYKEVCLLDQPYRPRPRQVRRPGGQGSGEDGRRADRGQGLRSLRARRGRRKTGRRRRKLPN